MSREARILDAALELFSEQGFAAVAVDAIGARAGVHGPTIYKHFSGKGELLATLIDRAMDRLLSLTAPQDGADDPGAELERLVRGHIAFALGDRRLLSVYAQDARSLPMADRRRARRRQREYVERWVAAIEACDPRRPAPECEAAAHAAIGLIQSVIYWPDALVAAPGIDAAIARSVLSGIGGSARPTPRRGTGRSPRRASR